MAVYFALAEGLGLVKIGFARDPRKRLIELRAGCPVALRPLLVLAGHGAALEYDLHRHFAALHSKGEWFRHDGELRDFIERFSAKAPIVRVSRAELAVPIHARPYLHLGPGTLLGGRKRRGGLANASPETRARVAAIGAAASAASPNRPKHDPEKNRAAGKLGGLAKARNHRKRSGFRDA